LRSRGGLKSRLEEEEVVVVEEEEEEDSDPQKGSV